MASLSGRVPVASAIDAAEAGMRQTLTKANLSAEEVNTIVKQERLNMGRQLVRAVGPGGDQATDAGAMALRARLKAQDFGSDEQIEKVVDAWRQGSYDSPSYVRTAARLGEKPRTAPTAAPSGAGNPPPNPALAAQYVKEAQQRIADAAVRDATFTQAAQQTPALQPKQPPLAANHAPAPVPPLTQYRLAVRQLEERMGRDVTAGERAELMAKFFGGGTPHPGHPFWLGGGSPTE
jgi:hypothetical protein